jgi:hypothetical protein
MDWNSSLLRDPRQHTMVALRRCIMATVIAIPVLTGLLTAAPGTAVSVITGLVTVAPVIAIPVGTGLRIMAMLRSVVRSMGFAFDLPQVKTGIVRNFSPTFPSFESRDHLLEAVAGGFGQ